MKFTNKFNGHTYWISGNKVMVSNGELVCTSYMDVETFNNMIATGDLVKIEVTRETFRKLVTIAKAESPNYNVRFLAFVEHKGGEAWKGNVAGRNAAFMAWISDRKAEYKKRFPAFLIGGDVIASQEHFTDFIVSGEWL